VRGRQVLSAAGVLLAATLMVLGGMLVGARERARLARAGGPGGSAQVAALTGAATATSWPPAAGRVAGRATPADPAALARVPLDGRLLRRPAAPATVGGPATLGCRQLQAAAIGLLPAGCGRVALAPSGQPVLWVSGRVPATRALQLQVWWRRSPAAWAQALVATEPSPGAAWSGVEVQALALDRGGSTLLAAFRHRGPDGLLDYDLVRYPTGGRPRVAAHRGGLAHGRVTTGVTAAGPVLDDQAAAPGGAPACCPRWLDETRIAFLAGSFRYLARDRVAAAPAWGGPRGPR
jgi:hypothetical protein